MALLRAPRQATPSYHAGYARSAGESANPGLWRKAWGMWSPKLGITGGTLPDLSGQGTAAVIQGSDALADVWTRGAAGQQLFTNSVDNTYLSTKNYPIGTGDFTITCGCRHQLDIETATRNPLLGQGYSGADEFFLRRDVGHEIDVYFSNAQIIASSIDVEEDQDYSVTVTRKAGLVTLYFDGVSVGSATDALDITTASSLFFGYTDGAHNSRHWGGYLQGLMGIWGRALEPQEVRQLSADPLAPFRQKPRILSVPAAAPAGGNALNYGSMSLMGCGI
jgi:hypothetical protein